MGRMSDFDLDVRTLLSRTFALLIRLVPLESGTADPVGMSPDLIEQKNKSDLLYAARLDLQQTSAIFRPAL